MLNDKLIEAIQSSSKEFELILKFTSIVADYLGAEKVNFLWGKYITAKSHAALGINIMPIESEDNKIKSVWQIINGPKTLSAEQESELRMAGHVLILMLKNIVIKQQVIIDPLTKLYNRAYFDIRLKEDIDRSKRYNTPFSLLMIDIDHFKAFNDTYGHQVGDEVLITVGKVLRSNTRSSDVVFRYGGEEFSVFLPNATETKAIKAAERLRHHINSTVNAADRLRENIKKIPFIKDNKAIPISFSIGISAFSGANKSLTMEEMIRKADESLYRAKNMGRDRVEVIGKSEALSMLIVDDEIEYTRFLGDYFQKRGYKVTTANSGSRALELLNKDKFDIMFLDLKMPDIDGLDVLRRVPQIIKNMRVLVLTAIGEEDIKRITAEYGACEFVQKPISIEYLNKHLMARILEMRA